jgi:hypothetical protein
MENDTFTISAQHVHYPPTPSHEGGAHSHVRRGVPMLWALVVQQSRP